MGISDLFYALSSFLSLIYLIFDVVENLVWFPSEEFFCQLQGGGIQYFQLSSFLWTMCIAYHAYSVCVLAKPENVVYSSFKYYFFIGFVLPSVPIAILYSQEKFDISDHTWCWIKCANDTLRLFMFYLPLVVIYLINLICYIVVQRKMSSVGILPKFITPMTSYLIVFLIVAIFPLLNRLLGLIGTCIVPLYYLQAIFDPLLGFLNSLVYGYANIKTLCDAKSDQKQ